VYCPVWLARDDFVEFSNLVVDGDLQVEEETV
jgi:hypothetical protein